MRQGQTFTETVPTAAERGGILSALGVPIYDPLTTCGVPGYPACAEATKPGVLGERVGGAGRLGVEGGAGVWECAREHAKSSMAAKGGWGRCMGSRFGLFAEV